MTIAQFDAQRVIESFLPKCLPTDFSGLAIPLKLIATDFYGWHETALVEGPLRPAIAASAAIPVLFRPVIIDGRVFVDGGITNPLPFDHAGDDVDIVVAVDVIGGPVGDHHRRAAVRRGDVRCRPALHAGDHPREAAARRGRRTFCSAPRATASASSTS